MTILDLHVHWHPCQAEGYDSELVRTQGARQRGVQGLSYMCNYKFASSSHCWAKEAHLLEISLSLYIYKDKYTYIQIIDPQLRPLPGKAT